jgi:HK97 gp10 family phage protein
MTFRVEINTKEFEQRLQEHLDEKCKIIADQIKVDAKTGAYMAERKFKDITGALRKSIKTKKSKYDDGGYIVKAGGRGAMQSWLIEHGHGGPRPAPAFPFLKPALDKNIRFAEMVLREKMRNE